MSIAEFSIHRPIMILMIVCCTAVLGVLSLMKLPVELMPDISYKQITIKVELRGGGLPPEEAEALIVRPIEDAIGAVSNLDSVVSTAEKERAIVRLFFNPGTAMDFASLEVREAFSKVKNKLPAICEKPVIAKYEENDKPIIILAVTSIGEKHSSEEIRTIVDQKIKEKLMRVPGVANVDVVGGRLEKIICNIDQKFIQANKVPIRKIVNKIGVNTLNVQVGAKEDRNVRKGIVFQSEFQSIDEIKSTAITTTSQTGSQVLLKAMADVKRDYMEAKEIARLTDFKDEKKSGGETSKIVSIRIQKENTANTVHVSDEVKEKLAILEEELMHLYPDLRILKVADQAKMITEAIQNVKSNLVSGALLAFLILLLFLMHLGTTLIIVIAIPVSMLITFIFMNAFHIPLNVFTLSGLALASGMLVDNSITVLENIFVKKTRGMSPMEASIKGSNEMVMEIITGTFTTIVVFAPIFFTDEQISMKYEGLAKTVICALITSLFAAIMIVPTLSARVKIHTTKKKSMFKPMLILKKSYLKILIFGIRYRWILVLFSVIFFVFCLVKGGDLKQELAGSTENNTFTIFVELPDGAKLEVSDTVISEIEVLLKNKELFSEIESVTSNVEGWSSKIYVSVVPKIKRTRTIKDLIEELRKKVPTLKTVKKTDAFVYYSEDGGEETEEVHIDVYGPEYAVLKKLANETAAKMEQAPGMVDAKLAMTEGRPELWIKPKKYRAGEFGLSTQEIAEIIHAQLQGLRATAFHPKDGSGSEIETMVRLDPKYLQSLNDVKNITIDSPKGQLLFLKDIASFEEGLSPSEIWRTNKSRMIGVSATSTQLPMEEVIPKIKENLKGVEFPKDYYYVFSGTYYKMLEKKRQLIWALFATILLVYMVLAALFESYTQPFIIMTSVPMALIGAVLGLWYANESVTMGVFIGGILLAGIAVNATIMLISSANQIREEKNVSVNRAVLNSAMGRTRPILMTSFATIIGFYPMASDSSQFSVLWAPLAITVIGGNISATLMTLFIVPGLYVIFEDMGKLGKLLWTKVFPDPFKKL